MVPRSVQSGDIDSVSSYFNSRTMPFEDSEKPDAELRQMLRGYGVSEHLVVLVKWPEFVFQIRQAVFYVHAFWSGPSVAGLRSLLQAMSQKSLPAAQERCFGSVSLYRCIACFVLCFAGNGTMNTTLLAT